MSCRRRGSLLMETAVAVVVLSLVFLAAAHLLAIAGRQRQELQWHSLATLEAANALERIIVVPWDELTSDGLVSQVVSPTAARRLPDPRLRVDVQPSEGPPSVKRIRVQVDWVNLAGQRGEPVELIAWKHQMPEGGVENDE